MIICINCPTHCMAQRRYLLTISTTNCLLHAPCVCGVLRSQQEERIPASSSRALSGIQLRVAPEGAWVCRQQLQKEECPSRPPIPTLLPPLPPTCHANSAMICVSSNMETLGKQRSNSPEMTCIEKMVVNSSSWQSTLC